MVAMSEAKAPEEEEEVVCDDECQGLDCNMCDVVHGDCSMLVQREDIASLEDVICRSHFFALKKGRERRRRKRSEEVKKE